jgi:hypothetical protein
MLKVGDILTAKWTENLVDYVTKDKTYEVSRVEDIGFYIINDKGTECFPVSAQFKRKGESAE